MIFLSVAILSILCPSLSTNPENLKEEGKKYCKDEPSLTIDGQSQIPGGPLYLFYGDFKRAIKVTQFKTNHLPVFQDDKKENLQKMSGNEVEKLKKQNDNSSRFLFFPKKFYYFYMKTRTTGQAFGFNQIWVGCPQPFCLDSTVDTMVKTETDTYLFRGKYFWLLKPDMSPKVAEAKLIGEDSWPDAPQFLDASFVFKKKIFLIRDGRFWSFKSPRKSPEKTFTLDVMFKKLPSKFKPRSALVFNEISYLFQNSIYSSHDFKKSPDGLLVHKKETVKTLNPQFPVDGLDATFVDLVKGQIYFLSGWNYFSVAAKDFPESLKSAKIEWKPSFLEVFKCSEDFYKNTPYKSFSGFVQEVVSLHAVHDINVQATIETPKQVPELVTEHRADKKATEPLTKANVGEPSTDSKVAEPSADESVTESVEKATEAEPTENAKEVEPLTDAKEAEPLTDAKEAEPTENMKEAEPTENTKEAEPLTDVKEAEPQTDSSVTEPLGNVKEGETLTDAKVAEPSSDTNATKPWSDAKVGESLADTNVSLASAEVNESNSIDQPFGPPSRTPVIDGRMLQEQPPGGIQTHRSTADGQTKNLLAWVAFVGLIFGIAAVAVASATIHKDQKVRQVAKAKLRRQQILAANRDSSIQPLPTTSIPFDAADIPSSELQEWIVSPTKPGPSRQPKTDANKSEDVKLPLTRGKYRPSVLRNVILK